MSIKGLARRSVALCLFPWLVLSGLLTPLSTEAQQLSGNCFISGQAVLEFGTVDPIVGASTNDGMEFGCSVSPTVPAMDVHVRLCVFIGEDPNAPGYMPRYMVGDSTQDLLTYDLFFDAAQTQLIGPPGSSLPVNSWTMTVPASANGSPVYGSFQIYGRVNGGQQGVAADRYQSHPQGSELRYYFSADSTIPVEACNFQEAQHASFSLSGVYAQVVETCRIMSASDMDFGQVRTLAGGRDQVSRITMTCPQGMAWQVGLSDGANAAGSTRRMAGPDGNFIVYELYRDAARTLRWGNTLNDDTSVGTGQGSTTIDLPVYGRVEEQPAAAGSYQDTVIVTLTF